MLSPRQLLQSAPPRQDRTAWDPFHSTHYKKLTAATQARTDPGLLEDDSPTKDIPKHTFQALQAMTRRREANGCIPECHAPGHIWSAPDVYKSKQQLVFKLQQAERLLQMQADRIHSLEEEVAALHQREKLQQSRICRLQTASSLQEQKVATLCHQQHQQGAAVSSAADSVTDAAQLLSRDASRLASLQHHVSEQERWQDIINRMNRKFADVAITMQLETDHKASNAILHRIPD